jgi:L-lactate dehydrogenase
MAGTSVAPVENTTTNCLHRRPSMSHVKTAVGIIGTGWVGSSVAISTLHLGLVQELLLHDARPGLAEGEAMDLSHGASFYPTAAVRQAPLDALLHAQAVVIAAGRASTAKQSRLELLRENAALATELGVAFRGYEGTIIMVTNPVDVLTYVFQRASGLPVERVLGTGTMLDTARLRHALGRELAVAPASVHAQVIGEHGDSEVVLWSSARVAGTPLRQWSGWSAEREAAIAGEVRTAAYEIIQRKGATNHAIGLVTARLVQSILRDERRVLTVSRVHTGAAMPADVALSLPAVVGASGADTVIVPEMDEPERSALDRSGRVLREAIESLESRD